MHLTRALATFTAILLWADALPQIPDAGERGYKTQEGRIGFTGICRGAFFTAGCYEFIHMDLLNAVLRYY